MQSHILMGDQIKYIYSSQHKNEQEEAAGKCLLPVLWLSNSLDMLCLEMSMVKKKTTTQYINNANFWATKAEK